MARRDPRLPEGDRDHRPGLPGRLGDELVPRLPAAPAGVSWPAVFVGWLVDFALSIAIQVAAAWLGLSAFFTAPDLSLPTHLLLMVLLLSATAVGGLVAARIGESAHMLTGVLVAATGILATTVSNPGLVPVPPTLIVGQALSLAAGALGGLLARVVAGRQAA